MPPPESGCPLILVGFGVFNRRVMQLASRGESDRARAGSSFVDFEGSFFLYFRKKLRARATRNKENNNSGLTYISYLQVRHFSVLGWRVSLSLSLSLSPSQSLSVSLRTAEI